MVKQDQGALIDRDHLNAEESSLLSLLLRSYDEERTASMLRHVDQGARVALEPLVRAWSELSEEGRRAQLHAWAGFAHDRASSPLALMSDDLAQHHRAYLDARWRRVIDLARHRDDPLAPKLPGRVTLDVASAILARDMGLEQERAASPVAGGEAFNLARFLSWEPMELVHFAERLGFLVFARALTHKDRRAVARQLHALPAARRAVAMEDMRRDTCALDTALLKRVDEVLISLKRRAQGTLEQTMISLGLYILVVAAGRRMSSRAFELAGRLPHPYGLEMHHFVEQHRVSSRRGLEQGAVHAVESLMTLLSER